MGQPTAVLEAKKARREGGIFVAGVRMKSPADRDPEYRIAAIKDLIIRSPGEVITGEQFNNVAQCSSAGVYVRKLIAQGKVSRFKVKNGQRGHSYRYEWNTIPVTQMKAKVTTTSLGLPDLPIDEKAPDDLDKLFLEWSNKAAMTGNINAGNWIVGAVKFREFVLEKLTEVQKKRQQIIDEHTGGGNA